MSETDQSITRNPLKNDSSGKFQESGGSNWKSNSSTRRNNKNKNNQHQENDHNNPNKKRVWQKNRRNNGNYHHGGFHSHNGGFQANRDPSGHQNGGFGLTYQNSPNYQPQNTYNPFAYHSTYQHNYAHNGSTSGAEPQNQLAIVAKPSGSNQNGALAIVNRQNGSGKHNYQETGARMRIHLSREDEPAEVNVAVTDYYPLPTRPPKTVGERQKETEARKAKERKRRLLRTEREWSSSQEAGQKMNEEEGRVVSDH
ncbi:uncharacterized protein MELLADRAFT_107384 [Melampsora larici-populina 98AG31]|uniref:Uncharacterized protein n=1 Tax=Melampsora larici-populina (strain 98AG31 / pathotype 3-4-7) TaxID=747676 RepID=F4RPL7_MELLP|nr:uncharacterized protein MELLADRAFT_107384 [Melampsora larici-populina 98AG31]EGG05556.1 hypothetical protein MELLADRAFT_107384 [Melampsora larici-populina 98AG31]